MREFTKGVDSLTSPAAAYKMQTEGKKKRRAVGTRRYPLARRLVKQNTKTGIHI